jgi:hypothetical protein
MIQRHMDLPPNSDQEARRRLPMLLSDPEAPRTLAGDIATPDADAPSEAKVGSPSHEDRDL